MGFETIEPIEPRHKNTQNMFAAPITSVKSQSISDQPGYSRNSKSAVTSPSSNNSGEGFDGAQKKFGSAKAISSDQYFNNEASAFERSVNLNRFQGSNSISSSDYFGDGQSNSNQRSSSNRSKFFKLIT